MKLHSEMKLTLDWLINEQIKLTDITDSKHNRYGHILAQLYTNPNFDRMSQAELKLLLCDCLVTLIDNYSDLITKE